MRFCERGCLSHNAMNDRDDITVTPEGRSSLRPGMKWLPVEGEEANGIAERSKLDEQAQEKLIETSAEILGKGIDPRRPEGSTTGLVVGYVQSGKTLSFTTVIGLARDNGFPLVIVVAGTSLPLLRQSTQRLR